MAKAQKYLQYSFNVIYMLELTHVPVDPHLVNLGPSPTALLFTLIVAVKKSEYD